MEEKIIEKTEEKIKEILDDDISPSNLDNLYKLSKIKHMAKEDKNMNYGNYRGYGARGPVRGSYGRDEYGRGGYGEYGNYGEYGESSYGRRGRDMRYRGDDYMDRMSGEYGRYMENRERYGAGSEETDKSFHYMIEAYKDFTKVLFEEAETPQQKQMLREAIQQSMM